MTKQSWYRIAAKKGDDSRAEILIYDEIGRNFWGKGIAAEDLVKELSALDVKAIDVRINSVGGQVFEGLAIFNALDRHPATVTTHVDGMAASIASIVALAGDEVRIAENAFMMIHNPHGIEMGDANAMRKMADILDTLAGSLADTYVAKTGKSEKVIRAMMDEETWFNAEEALEVGMVDEVDEAMDVAASFDLSKFHNVRPDVLERAAEKVRPMGKVVVEADLTARLEKVADELEELADNAEQAELVQLAAEAEETLARTLL
jgi:ATP-dependent Clp endopeptidase proteolytic subunit ClpP